MDYIVISQTVHTIIRLTLTPCMATLEEFGRERKTIELDKDEAQRLANQLLLWLAHQNENPYDHS